MLNTVLRHPSRYNSKVTTLNLAAQMLLTEIPPCVWQLVVPISRPALWSLPVSALFPSALSALPTHLSLCSSGSLREELIAQRGLLGLSRVNNATMAKEKTECETQSASAACASGDAKNMESP